MRHSFELWQLPFILGRTTRSGLVQFYYGRSTAVLSDNCTNSGGTWSKS